jgi:hypothetical protein
MAGGRGDRGVGVWGLSTPSPTTVQARFRCRVRSCFCRATTPLNPLLSRGPCPVRWWARLLHHHAHTAGEAFGIDRAPRPLLCLLATSPYFSP